MKTSRWPRTSLPARAIRAATLVALCGWILPCPARKVICIDGCNSAFVNNHEGWERQNTNGTTDIVVVGGNLTDCLTNVMNGDELIIVAHGFDGGEGFNWGGASYTNFGNGTDEMPVPPGFSMLSNVTVRFCTCWSARDPDTNGPNTPLTAKVVSALGGTNGGNTATGFTDIAHAEACFRLLGGSSIQQSNANFTLTNNGAWMDNPPVNRRPPATNNQQTAAQNQVNQFLSNNAVTVIITGYKRPVDRLTSTTGGAVSGCECPDSPPYCGIGGGLLDPPPTIPTVSEWGLIVLTLLLLISGTLALRHRARSAREIRPGPGLGTGP